MYEALSVVQNTINRMYRTFDSLLKGLQGALAIVVCGRRSALIYTRCQCEKVAAINIINPYSKSILCEHIDLVYCDCRFLCGLFTPKFARSTHKLLTHFVNQLLRSRFTKLQSVIGCLNLLFMPLKPRHSWSKWYPLCARLFQL